MLKTISQKLTALVLFTLAFLIGAILIQDANAQGFPDLTAFEPVLAAYIESLSGTHGWIVQVVLIIGSLRVVFKPLMPFVHAVVSQTKTTKDDEILGKVESSVYFKVFSWLLDFGASIKVKKEQK